MINMCKYENMPYLQFLMVLGWRDSGTVEVNRREFWHAKLVLDVECHALFLSITSVTVLSLDSSEIDFLNLLHGLRSKHQLWQRLHLNDIINLFLIHFFFHIPLLPRYVALLTDLCDP